MSTKPHSKPLFVDAVSTEADKTKKSPLARKPSINFEALLIRRPSPERYQQAIDLWKMQLEAYGKRQLALARKKAKGNQRTAPSSRPDYQRIAEAAAYAGVSGLVILLDITKEARLPESRELLLDIIESVRNMHRQIETTATLERLWPDGSLAVSVQHDKIGWLEFDMSAKCLPTDAQPGDRFNVRIHLDRAGNYMSHQIPLGTKIQRSTKPSVGVLLEEGLPKPPANWGDPADVARYHREMNEWERNSPLGRGKTRCE